MLSSLGSNFMPRNQRPFRHADRGAAMWRWITGSSVATISGAMRKGEPVRVSHDMPTGLWSRPTIFLECCFNGEVQVTSAGVIK